MTARIALVARERVSWRALALTALLSLLLGAAFTQLLRAGIGGSSASSAARTGAGVSSLAPAARASISATLGAENPAYRFAATPTGLHGANPAQHLAVEAAATGVTLHARSLSLGLSLQALGYGGALERVPAARPSGAVNRVAYARAGIAEWYVNGPFGLEQGFTLAHAPAASAARAVAGPLTLAIALSGDARASLAPGAQSVTFSGPHGGALRYGGLSVSDASGRTLRSWLALDGGRLLLRVDARGARYPLRVDPSVEAAERRLSPMLAEEKETEGKEDAGISVALSGDGDTALVGAPDAAGTGGAAWVFTRSGTSWTQQAKLELPKAALSELEEGETSTCAEEGESEEGDECGFGRSVALSASGDTAVIGAPRMHSGEGAAWIFAREGSTWTSTPTELTSPRASSGGHFGRSVALSGSGETALVGAPGELAGNGRAWVFTGSGANTSWVAQGGPLTGSAELGEGRFGRAVALAGDGDTALVGGPGDDGFVGAAWVFVSTEDGWTAQSGKLTGAGEVSDGHFGYSVALSEDGGTALMGARDDNGGTGAAWVFARSGSTWSEQGAKLIGAGAENEQFGYSVTLSAAGDSAIVGAPRVEGGRGAAWVFARSGTSWTPALRELVAGSTEETRAHFGSSVAASANGEVVLVGGPGESAKRGAAWVFGQGPAVESIKPHAGTTLGGTTVTITGEHLGGVTAVRFGSSEAASFAVDPEDPEHEITAVSPPEAAGRVDVTVETAFGASSPSTLDRYTFTPPGHKSGQEETEQGQGGNGNGNGGGNSGNGGNEQTTGNKILPVGTEEVLALGPTSGPVCGASLRSKRIAVQAHNRALFKLLGTGAGSCAGKLRVRVKLKAAHGHFKLKTIGVAVFSIAAGRHVSVSVKLNAAGRALLKAGHGRLNASVLLVKSLPTPMLARTASVRLARSKPKPRAKT